MTTSSPLYEDDLLGFLGSSPSSIDSCFLCGADFLSSQRTREHIFPSWLQKKLDLAKKSIVLLNSDRVAYGNKGIRAILCSKCNSDTLGRLENYIKQHVDNGYEKFKGIDRFKLFHWLCKIFFSLLWTERGYKSKHYRSVDPELNKSISEFVEEETGTLLFHLRTLLFPVTFIGQPFSMFIFKTHVYDEMSGNFDFFSVPEAFWGLALRMNDIGIVACLEDNGRVESCMNAQLIALRESTLHPFQFREVASRIFLEAMTFPEPAFYFTGTDGNSINHQCFPGSVKGQGEHDFKFELSFLSYHLGIDEGALHGVGDNLIRTTLWNHDGSAIETVPETVFQFGNYYVDFASALKTSDSVGE